MTGIFEHLLVLGRPAGGKSEFIDYMLHQPAEFRAQRYHLGQPVVMDDFPILWDYYLDDDLREEHGLERDYSYRTEQGGYATNNPIVWYLLIDRLNRIVRKECLEQPEIYDQHTVLIEFARGTQQGYRRALAQLEPESLQRGAILYISVSFEESWRRNLSRYDERRKAGILTHMVAREVMERAYSHDDWFELTTKLAGYLTIGEVQVPYVTMDNEEESTDPVVLDGRYGAALNTLWELLQAR